VWAFILLSNASAACAEPYTLDGMAEDLASTEQGLRAGDADGASAGAQRLLAGLVCLDSPLNSTLSAWVYRSMGAGLAAGEMQEKAQAWMRTAVEIDPGYVFGVDEMPQDHPGRQAWESASGPAPEPSVLGEVELTEGTWKLDGRRLDGPAATPDRPHLLQRELDGSWEGWILDGDGFPAESLRQAKAEKPDKLTRSEKRPRRCRKGIRFKGFIAADGNYCPATPPEQVFFSISGPLVIGSATLLYAESLRQYGLTRDAATIDTMRQHKRINNRLFAASMSVAGLGVGIGIFGLTYTGSF